MGGVKQRNKLTAHEEFGGKVPEVFEKETYRSCTSVLERYKSCCYLLLPVATSFSVAGFPSTISLQHCSGHDWVRMLMTFGGELTAVPGVVLFGSAIPRRLMSLCGTKLQAMS